MSQLCLGLEQVNKMVSLFFKGGSEVLLQLAGHAWGGIICESCLVCEFNGDGWVARSSLVKVSSSSENGTAAALALL